MIIMPVVHSHPEEGERHDFLHGAGTGVAGTIRAEELDLRSDEVVAPHACHDLIKREVWVEADLLIAVIKLEPGRSETVFIAEHEEVVRVHSNTCVVHICALAEAHEHRVHARESLHA